MNGVAACAGEHTWWARVGLRVGLLTLLAGCGPEVDSAIVGAPDPTGDVAGSDTAPDPTSDVDQTSGAGDTGETASAVGPTRYPTDRVHSPLSAAVVEQIDEILAVQPDPALDVFMKVGDSITYSSLYLHCFAGDAVDLAAHTELADTLSHFLGGTAQDSTPFDRWSASVKGGRTASWAMTGDPSPLQQEIDAIDPALAVVMFGTNDCGYFAPDTEAMLRWYGRELLALVDALIDQGIVPLLMTIPPSTRETISALDELVNALVRGLAQGHQIPLIDYHQVMLAAPDLGLSSDGVHPYGASAGACVFDEEGLEAGYNIRNLLTLEALDRVRRVIEDDAPSLDEQVPLSAGSGSPDDPIEIDLLPFTRLRDTSASPHREIDAYTGCGATQDESGPEEHYRLSLSEDTALRIGVVDADGVDIDIHLLGQGGHGADCLARSDTLLEGTLAAGEYRLVLDTYVSEGIEQAGAYLVLLAPCDGGDAACETQIGR